jgi:hypothetical protein
MPHYAASPGPVQVSTRSTNVLHVLLVLCAVGGAPAPCDHIIQSHCTVSAMPPNQLHCERLSTGLLDCSRSWSKHSHRPHSRMPQSRSTG